MMATPRKAHKAIAKKSTTKALAFLEELLWVFERFGISQGKEYIQEIEKELKDTPSKRFGLDNFTPKNPNQLFLVGILPKIFSDEKLFVSNKELADFSRDILKVDISRWDKRSRYELIGHIICSTTVADDKQLETIASALKKLQSDNLDSDDFLKRKIQEEKKSWNDIIQILLKS